MSAMSRDLAMPAIVLIYSVFLCVLCGSRFQFLRSLAISTDFGNVFRSVSSVLISGKFLVSDLLRTSVSPW